MKGMYHYLRDLWKKPKVVYKTKMIEWRKSNSVVRVDKPLRLDRAHALGYKAKKGFSVARVRIRRGGRKRPSRMGLGRRSKRQTIRKTLKMNYKWVAEQRVARKFSNLEVLNSYFIGKDGKHYFFEVILVDPSRPEIKTDRQIKWILSKKHKARAFRGLTSSARKSRGLRKKGKRAIKTRPSIRSRGRQGK
jgi:large subunit ribosomal protein L15e